MISHKVKIKLTKKVNDREKTLFRRSMIFHERNTKKEKMPILEKKKYCVYLALLLQAIAQKARQLLPIVRLVAKNGRQVMPPQREHIIAGTVRIGNRRVRTRGGRGTTRLVKNCLRTQIRIHKGQQMQRRSTGEVAMAITLYHLGVFLGAADAADQQGQRPFLVQNRLAQSVFFSAHHQQAFDLAILFRRDVTGWRSWSLHSVGSRAGVEIGV